MSVAPSHTFPPICGPCTIPLDTNHVAEVRNKGKQIGIYAVTQSGKKRGILLPVDTWHSLGKHVNLINVALDLVNGTVALDTVADTIYQTPSHLHQQHRQLLHQQQQQQPVNFIYTNNVNHSRNRQRHVWQRQGPYTLCRADCETKCVPQAQHAGSTTTRAQQATAPTPTATSTTVIPDQFIYKPEGGRETPPFLEYFGPCEQGGNGPESICPEETDAPGDVDALCATYIC